MHVCRHIDKFLQYINVRYCNHNLWMYLEFRNGIITLNPRADLRYSRI